MSHPTKSLSLSHVDGVEMVEVPCALCHSPEHHFWIPLKRSRIVRCNKCHLPYVSPRASDSVLKNKIQAWAEKDVFDTSRLANNFDSQTSSIYRSYISRVLTLSKMKPGLMLDVGCSVGGLLEVAKEKGFEAEGLELGRASAKYVREELGYKVYEGSIDEQVLKESHYDLISFLEVIEHLPYPRLALSKIYQALKPGGHLLLSTPNVDSLFRRLRGNRWWVINCEDEHIVLFNLSLLGQILKKEGFEIQWSSYRGIDFLGLFKSFSVNKNRHQPFDEEKSPHAVSTKRKDRLKFILKKIGLLKLVRIGLSVMNKLYSSPFSPFYGWGEQIVLIAKKTEAPQ